VCPLRQEKKLNFSSLNPHQPKTVCGKIGYRSPPSIINGNCNNNTIVIVNVSIVTNYVGFRVNGLGFRV
jgi:hypothetical protein